MGTYQVYWIEWHSPETSAFFKSLKSHKLTGEDNDGWSEFEVTEAIKAMNDKQALSKAYKLDHDGIFNLNKNGKRIATEDGLEDGN